MSSTTTATAELKALAEQLAEATKQLELARAMTNQASNATNNYSASLHASAIIAEREAAKAYEEAAQAIEDLETKSKKASEEVSKLFAKAFGEEVPEKLEDTKKALAAVSNQSLSTGDRAKGLFAAVGLGASAFRAAVVGAAGYAQQLLAVGQAALEARAASERQLERISAVADVMNDVRTATRGAATEQDAFTTRTELLNAGLLVNARTVAQTIAFAREHRRAGEENAEAVRRVVAAIQGNAQAQSELGLQVRSGSTALEAQVQVMRQLEAANAAQAPSAQRATERQQQVEQGFERVKNGAIALFGTLTQFSAIYEGLADGANALGAAQQELAVWWRQGTTEAQRQTQVLRQQTARERELLAQQQAAQQQRDQTLRGIREEIALRTAQTGVESGFLDLTAQINAVQQVYSQRQTQQAALSRRHNESEEAFLQRQLDALNNVANARQQLVQLTQQQEQQRRASDELGLQASTLRNLGLQVSSQVRSLSIQASYNGLLREARDLRRSELETQAEFEQRAAATLQALEQARQRAIQAAQAAQQARDARFALGRSVDSALLEGVPGFAGLRGVSRRTSGDEYARTYGDVFSRRRAGESPADFDNRRSSALQRLVEIRTRNVEAELRMEEARRAFLERQGESASVVDERMQSIQGNQDSFRGMREGIGLQLAMRVRQRQATNALELSGGAAEGNLLKLISQLEQQSTALLSQGGADNARRAAQIQAEAQAVTSAIDSYRELAQAQREAGDAGAQFEQRWLPSAERTRTTAAKMADFSVFAFQQFSNAVTQHVLAMVQGQETFSEGMRAMVHETGLAIAQEAGKQALWEGAQALAAVAKGIGGNPIGFAEAAAHGVAAAAYLGLATAGGVAAAVTTPPASAASAASSAGAAPAARGSDVGNSSGGSIVYQYNYNGLLTLPEAGRTILRAQRAAERNGHTLEG